MADITPTQTERGPWRIYSWSSVTEADTPLAAQIDAPVAAATFQVSGTFGSATVIAQGSNDNSAWVALDDVENTAISHTAAGGSELRYVWPYIRPSISGGSSQSLTITLAVQIEPANR